MFSRVNLVTSVGVLSGAKIYSVNSKRHYKVTVIGASGGIGQPLSLLLKMNNLVSHLSLYDVSPITPGVAVDLSHINTACRVTGHKGPEQLCDALMCASVVVIPAGVPRKPGMKREDLFNVNAGLIRDMSKAIAKYCPMAIIAIITNPVNSMVPIAAEVLKLEGTYDPRRLMGVTTLDVVRACTFIGQVNGIDPKDVSIPVIGGHSGPTIIPLFSQSRPPVKLYSCHQVYKLTEQVQEAGTAVVKAKGGGGSATLSMAFSGARFTASILRGLAEGVYDPRRVMGVTTLDVVRACTFIGEINCIDPKCVSVACIGGHSGPTIIPILSQSYPAVNLGTWAEVQKLTEKVQEAGTAVVKAKGGGGSATLSMAFAGAKFTSSVLNGLAGQQNVVECAYVASGLCEPAYFANPILLGPCGMARNLGFSCLNPFEMQLLRKAMPELLKNIKVGEQFALTK